MQQNSYTIGQVSAICDLSIQGLRYYDQINLLKPSQRDPSNGYRYYTDKDIMYLRIIQDLKETGFTLEEIKKTIGTENTRDILAVLSGKRQELQAKLLSIQSILERVDGRIANLQLSNNEKNNVNQFLGIEIKKLPERKVAYIRYKSSIDHATRTLRFYELERLLKKYAVVPHCPRMAVYHSSGNNSPENFDLEVCVPIDGEPQNFDPAYIRTIDAALYATAIYQGPYLEQCNALEKWVSDHHYQISGPTIEIYLNSFMNTRFPKQFITEIQIPIKNS